MKTYTIGTDKAGLEKLKKDFNKIITIYPITYVVNNQILYIIDIKEAAS